METEFQYVLKYVRRQCPVCYQKGSLHLKKEKHNNQYVYGCKECLHSGYVKDLQKTEAQQVYATGRY